MLGWKVEKGKAREANETRGMEANVLLFSIIANLHAELGEQAREMRAAGTLSCPTIAPFNPTRTKLLRYILFTSLYTYTTV